MTIEDYTDAMSRVGLADLQQLSAACDATATPMDYQMCLIALALAARAYLRRPHVEDLLSLTFQRDAVIEAIKLIEQGTHPTIRSAALDLARLVATLTVQRDAAIAGLKRYGHCDANCTRRDMKGPCSCGFCRFSDAGGLFDIEPTPGQPKE